ncbi:MAG: alpha/beta hydrolase [Actinomycetota bacterium]
MTERASAGSAVARTAMGPVEYDDRGSGPVVLHFHGGNVGHNGAFLLDHLAAAGRRLITPDRPGYLGTPLGDHGAPEAQADLFAALLDELEIDRVAVVGISAGGPGAVQFAVRHPERTDALVLLSAMTRSIQLRDEQLDSVLGRLVLSERFQDVSALLISEGMRRLPRASLREFARTETTHDDETARQLVDQILDDPGQRAQVMALAEALVPGRPRFAGVMNDVGLQQHLQPLPLDAVGAPALVIHSEYDGDVPFDGAVAAHDRLPDSELLTVRQFGHFVSWGDPEVARDIEARLAAFLDRHAPR